MTEYPYGHIFSPLQIAVAYVAFGGVWITLSDNIVAMLVESPALMTQIQTLKGWGFVVLSGVLIFGLTSVSYRQLQEANRDLQETLQQTHVLHRILRHNLRNKCNIIAGQSERLYPDGGVEVAETIREHTTELIELSEKSRRLREASLVDHPPVEVNLVRIVEDVVTDIERSYTGTTIQTDLPDKALVSAHPEIQQAVHELVVNAIKHNGPAPIVVRVCRSNHHGFSVAVIDNGPGLPQMEQEVLEEGFVETPTKHSLGLGLWLVRFLVRESRGTVSVESSSEQGTTIRLTFNPSSDAILDRFFH